MSIKPDCYGPEVASAFDDVSVAQAYQYRPAYPEEVFALLDGLIVDQPRHVLDVACGTGLLARPLAELVEQVDALDSSRAMIAQGQRQPGGEHPRIRWMVGRAEAAPLRSPYALIVAGDSIHWLDWDQVMPRFAGMLTPKGSLALLSLGYEPTPWDDELGRLIPRYSTITNFQSFDAIKTLEERGYLHVVGVRHTTPVPFVQPVEDYVESFHARASCSRQRMAPDAAAAFDAAVRALVAPHSHEGRLDLRILAEVVWGKPLKGTSASVTVQAKSG